MTYAVPKTLARNALIVICALLVGYGCMVVATYVEMNFSKSGEILSNGDPTAAAAAHEPEEFFEAMESTLFRARFIYLPLGLFLPACVIAIFARGWEWAWLLTAMGCAFSLMSVFFSFSNPGWGLIGGVAAYLAVASVVTIIIYRRERHEESEA